MVRDESTFRALLIQIMSLRKEHQSIITTAAIIISVVRQKPSSVAIARGTTFRLKAISAQMAQTRHKKEHGVRNILILGLSAPGGARYATGRKMEHPSSILGVFGTGFDQCL